VFDLGRTFLASVERSPNATAIVDGATRLTYAAWHDEIRRVLAGLDELGLRHGDHLLAVLQNRLEMATLHWACQFAGIVVTPLGLESTFEAFGSVVAGIALLLAVEATRTRPRLVIAA